GRVLRRSSQARAAPAGVQDAVAAEKSDTHALPNRPALDTGTKRIDPPNELVAGDARPINGELALYRAGIRVADPTRLDTNPDLTWRGRRQFPLHHFQAAGLTRLHSAIACRCHRRLLRFENAILSFRARRRARNASQAALRPAFDSLYVMVNGGGGR